MVSSHRERGFRRVTKPARKQQLLTQLVHRFKIYENGYDPSTKIWGNDLLNKNCGKQDVKIPSDIAPGNYLLRAETIALHTASTVGGAQFYMTCYVS